MENNPKLPIVFVTAYDEYAIKAFELTSIDYVLKQVSSARLLKTVQRIEEVKGNIVDSPKTNNQLQLNLFKQVMLLECLDG